jgi:CubicO group peptidase (beta-lactamase class C family)
MDWVGILIERVSGESLEDVFQRSVLGPLGMTGVTFLPTDETRANLAYLHRRKPGGTLAQRDHLYAKPLRAEAGGSRNGIFCAGGHGLFGPPVQFRKLIGMLLNDGVDAASGARLLKKETVDGGLETHTHTHICTYMHTQTHTTPQADSQEKEE